MLKTARVKIVTGPVTPTMHNGWPPMIANMDPVTAVESRTSTGPSWAFPVPSSTVLRLSTAAKVMAGAMLVKNMKSVADSTFGWKPSRQSER